MFVKYGILKNFANFTRKHLVKFAKFLRTPYLKNIYELLRMKCFEDED